MTSPGPRAAGDANNDWELTWRLVRDKGMEASLDEVTERFEEIYQGTEESDGLRRTEGLLIDAEMLRRMAQRYKLGVVTGRPRSDAMTFLGEQGIADLFGSIVTMDDGPLKPSPAPGEEGAQGTRCLARVDAGRYARRHEGRAGCRRDTDRGRGARGRA